MFSSDSVHLAILVLSFLLLLTFILLIREQHQIFDFAALMLASVAEAILSWVGSGARI